MAIFLALLFGISRLINLMALPPYWDEIIYIRWLIAIKTHQAWLLPLKEFGWEPLNIWLAALANRAVTDPLLALRLTTTFFGGLSAIMAYKTIKLIYNKTAAIFTASLVIICPLLLVHDRLGLRGEAVISFVSWLTLMGLYLRLVKKNSWAVYLIAIALIVGLMTKTTAMALVPAVLLSYLFFRPRLVKADFLAALISCLPFLFFTLTDTLSNVLNKKDVFVLSWAQLGSLIKPNLIQAGLWFYQYLTWPILLVGALGLILVGRFYRRCGGLLLLNILPAFLLIILIGSMFFPRYLVSVVSLLLTFGGIGLAWLYQKLPRLLKPLLAIIFLPSLFLDFQIIKDIRQAKLPEIERWQYVTGWPSGYGLPELITYLKTNPPSVLVTEDNDLVKTGLTYLWPNYPFTITQIPTQNAYFVLNISEQLPEGIKGELIKEFPRPENKSSIKLFKLL
ncbi:MAG: glycosyltransferase family 39 protein [Candidatus Beckwithbacteria bacterium]